MTTPLPDDLRLIIVKRGENMRLMLPMDENGLADSTPYEVAHMAVEAFIQLQVEQPGYADAPVIAGVGIAYGLFLPNALGPLDPEMFLLYQLVGQWQEVEDVPVASVTGIFKRGTPVCVLNLIDMNAN